ncbi:MAG: UDP-3-O-acyl-N-acetylglucosamine deacetylase [Rickettsiales bacterium]|jgi:UDP-3-O-[3-hydroxymyristoyl] N-acetylglucosamine deacetylase|nr:UDP-3-O-acyl-N-acetylglucosamine deacetylase [Rickettsiales bacterium]
MWQKTIKNPIKIEGIGLHSGEWALLNLLPAEVGGIVFSSRDGASTGLAATYENVLGTTLGTTISSSDGTLRVSTIEHLMAAIWACDIDNLIIEIEGREVPILDGSSSRFIDKIENCGTVELTTPRKILKIKKSVAVENDFGWMEIKPSKNFSIAMEVQFDYGGIGTQRCFFGGEPRAFRENVAMARTFCNVRDIESMKSMGLARGGSRENAMIFDEKGLLNPDGFRCAEEVVKHKILDCVGDLFTAGHRMEGALVASKSGHELNNRLLKKIFRDSSNYALE